MSYPGFFHMIACHTLIGKRGDPTSNNKIHGISPFGDMRGLFLFDAQAYLENKREEDFLNSFDY